MWATQGIRYQRRYTAWLESSKGGGKGPALEITGSLLEAEAQTLEERYGSGRGRSEVQVLFNETEEELSMKCAKQLNAIRAKCRDFEFASFSNATLQEEQERELSPENEQERQVERPLALAPYTHSVHPDVKRFVDQGILHPIRGLLFTQTRFFTAVCYACIDTLLYPLTSSFRAPCLYIPDSHRTCTISLPNTLLRGCKNCNFRSP